MRVFVVMLGDVEVAEFKDFLSARNYADWKNKNCKFNDYTVSMRYKVCPK